MKRAGFTMIELIFVIVILGILAAVALPKFAGVTEQAKAGKVKAFLGTMNRTVLPTVWGDAMAKGYNGDISNTSLTSDDILKLSDVPEGVSITTTNNFGTNCGPTGTLTAVGTYDVGAGSHSIFCFEGNATTAPFFSFNASGVEANLTMP